MTPIPQPDSVPLAAPPFLFWTLLILTFLLHLLPMNLVLGGSIVAALARWRTPRNLGPDGELYDLVARLLPFLITAAITLGIAPLLFLQVLYGRLMYTSSVLLGWYWLLVIPALIVAYYGAYIASFKAKGRRLSGLWLSVAVALLFGSIAFVYSNNMSMMLRFEQFQPLYQNATAGMILNLNDPTLFPRFLHILLGALAVTSLTLAVAGIFVNRSKPALSDWLTRRGAIFFALLTGVNFAVGTWFLLSYDRTTLLAFVRSGGLGLLALVLATILGLAAIGAAVLSIQSEWRNTYLSVSVACLLATLLCMILVRDRVREVIVQEALGSEAWIDPQWGAILLFLLLLVGAILCVIWMVDRLVRSKGARP